MPLHPAAPADFAAAVDLVNLAYRGPSPPEGREWATETGYITGDRLTRPMLEADLQAPGARLMLWRDEPGAPVTGCVWLQPASSSNSEAAGQQEDGVWYLGMLTVHPDVQARGLGGAILEAAEQAAVGQGARRIRMTVVNVRDGLIAWYRRKGYAPTGEVLPFPYEDERFGKPGRPDLSFVVLERVLG